MSSLVFWILLLSLLDVSRGTICHLALSCLTRLVAKTSRDKPTANADNFLLVPFTGIFEHLLLYRSVL